MRNVIIIRLYFKTFKIRHKRGGDRKEKTRNFMAESVGTTFPPFFYLVKYFPSQNFKSISFFIKTNRDKNFRLKNIPRKTLKILEKKNNTR